MPAITSKDRRKTPLMGVFKTLFRCDKVTRLRETQTEYIAQCMIYNKSKRNYDSLGDKSILKSHVVIPD